MGQVSRTVSAGRSPRMYLSLSLCSEARCDTTSLATFHLLCSLRKSFLSSASPLHLCTLTGPCPDRSSSQLWVCPYRPWIKILVLAAVS